MCAVFITVVYSLHWLTDDRIKSDVIVHFFLAINQLKIFFCYRWAASWTSGALAFHGNFKDTPLCLIKHYGLEQDQYVWSISEITTWEHSEWKKIIIQGSLVGLLSTVTIKYQGQTIPPLSRTASKCGKLLKII